MRRSATGGPGPLSPAICSTNERDTTVNDDDRTQNLEVAGIGLEYDPNDGVLRIDHISPDGIVKTIRMNRQEAMTLYRSLGEILSPDLDG